MSMCFKLTKAYCCNQQKSIIQTCADFYFFCCHICRKLTVCQCLSSFSHNKTIKINGENKGNNVNKNQIHNKKGIPTAAANE